MDPLFAQELCELNNRFDRTWADSFSDTRHNTWPGWNRCLKESGLTDRPLPLLEQLHLLDVACGNLRFERHLARSIPNAIIEVQALDACDELAQNGIQEGGYDAESRTTRSNLLAYRIGAHRPRCPIATLP